MATAAIAPALSSEAQLKRRLRAHLRALGFTKLDNGTLAPPGHEKAAIRRLHQDHRRELLDDNRKFIATGLPNFVSYFADGTEVDPRRIKLAIQRITAGTWESALFRLATLTWSVPVSNGFGRRIRYLVWDEQNGKLAGLIALGDPVFNLAVRDEAIGWSHHDRAQRLVNVLDAYVLGAVPPYNMLLGGKAIASIVRTREVFDDFSSKYSDARGIISERKKTPLLLAVTTTSSLGRSSVYNRLRLQGIYYFRPIGYTLGWGHFHIPSALFTDFRTYLRGIGHAYADQHRFGQGPNWRLRTIRAALSALGLDQSLLRHGIRRQVFMSDLANNAIEILRTGTGVPDLNSLRSVEEVSSMAVRRWMSICSTPV